MNRIIDLVTLAEKRDPRIVAYKNARKAAKENAAASRENAAKRAQENEDGALAWIESEEQALKEANSANKAEREKLKKKQSAERNLLKKLLRAASTLGHGDKGEYGPFTEADIEIIAANADLNDLTAMTTAMGSKEAEKDNSLFQVKGIDTVTTKLAGYADRVAAIVDDERIAKETRKRESEAKFASPTKEIKEREWDTTMDDFANAALNRYPITHATRWQSICNFLNDRIKPNYVISLKEAQIRCWQLATNQQS